MRSSTRGCRVERLFEETAKAKSKTVSGREAFNLLQTYGFPPELTETLAIERGMHLDWDGLKKRKRNTKRIPAADSAKNSSSRDRSTRFVRHLRPPSFLDT